MKTIDLEQNTPEWLEFRKTKIGASDAPIILGMSPFKTPRQLFFDKMGDTIPKENEYMARGHELEPLARNEFNEAARIFWNNENICVKPLVVQSDDFDWMIASLDGIDTVNRILVEIKCPGEKDHSLAKEHRIPPKYYAQLQHQMFVTGYEEMQYFSYRNGDFAFVTCRRDEDFIKDMLEKEKEFVGLLKNKTPPFLIDRDYEDRNEVEFIDLASAYSAAVFEAECYQKEADKLKEKLVGLSNGRNCKGGGVKITHVERKGSVDYAKIPALKGIDLESYRKAPTTYASISLTQS